MFIGKREVFEKTVSLSMLISLIAVMVFVMQNLPDRLHFIVSDYPKTITVLVSGLIFGCILDRAFAKTVRIAKKSIFLAILVFPVFIFFYVLEYAIFLKLTEFIPDKSIAKWLSIAVPAMAAFCMVGHHVVKLLQTIRDTQRS